MDGLSRQPISHSQSHTSVWGEGPQNQPSGFEVSALPGLLAKDPQISLRVRERAHTYLCGSSVKWGLLLQSRQRSTRVTGLLPFSGQEPGVGVGIRVFVRELKATNQTRAPGGNRSLTIRPPPAPHFPAAKAALTLERLRVGDGG